MSSTEETESHAPAAQLILASELLVRKTYLAEARMLEAQSESCLQVKWREGQPVTQRRMHR